MAIEILFIDLNGTQVNDWLAGYAGAKRVFAAYDQPCPPLEDFVRHVAREGSYPSFYREHGVKNATNDDLHRHFIPGYRDALKCVQVMPGALSVLQKIRELGIAIHLVTMARPDFAEIILKHFGLHDYFDKLHLHIVHKDELMLRVMKEKKLEPKECVHIGDMPKDARDACKADVHNIVISNEHVPRDVFEDVPMDYYALDFYGLLQYIERH